MPGGASPALSAPIPAAGRVAVPRWHMTKRTARSRFLNGMLSSAVTLSTGSAPLPVRAARALFPLVHSRAGVLSDESSLRGLCCVPGVRRKEGPPGSVLRVFTGVPFSLQQPSLGRASGLLPKIGFFQMFPVSEADACPSSRRYCFPNTGFP